MILHWMISSRKQKDVMSELEWENRENLENRREDTRHVLYRILSNHFCHKWKRL